MNLIPRRYGIDDLFEDFFPTFNSTDIAVSNNMKCDIYEKNGKCHLELDIPGFKKEDISLECENGYLTITASKKEDEKEESKDKKYIRRERKYSKIERSFYVGDIETKDIEAEFKNGTLNVVIPILEKKDSKLKIDIK